MNRTRSILLAMAVCLIVPPVLSHILVIDRGIHFKTTNADFGLPPPRYSNAVIDFDGASAWRPGTKYFLDYDGDYVEDWEVRERRRGDYLRSITKLERKGRFVLAFAHLRTAYHRGYAAREDLDDNLRVLRLVVARPHLRGARDLLLGLRVDGSFGRLPSLEAIDRSLWPYVEYAEAIHVARSAGAPLRLIRIAEQAPNTPIAEPALIMSARSALGGNRADIDPADIRLGERALHLLMGRYPRTRFRYDVLGWRGRIAFLRGDYHVALTWYRAQSHLTPGSERQHLPIDSIYDCETSLGRPAGKVAAQLIRFIVNPDTSQKHESVARIDDEMAGLKSAGAAEFGHLVRSNVALLRAYIEYRLDFTKPSKELLALWDCQAAKKADRGTQGDIASSMAEVALRLDLLPRARHFSNLAARLARDDDAHAISLYILGTLAKRGGNDRLALALYSRLARRYPKSYVTNGAVENVAMLDERFGRLGAALDIYRRLKYDCDVDYVIDIRMSPAELRRYVDARPHDPKRNLLNFSVGYRYMRVHDWGRALRYFRRVPRSQRVKMVNDRWVVDIRDGDLPLTDPVSTVSDLRRLSARVAARHGVHRARAMLDLADYYYSHHDLLLYNGALWEGERQSAIQFCWNAYTASSADDRALDEHHWQHECFAHTLGLCRRILREYPGTPIAAKAAYRGACAAERLAGFSEYWRWKDTQANLSGEAVHLMKLAERSPDAWLAARATKFADVFAGDEKHSGTDDEYARKATRRYIAENQLSDSPDKGQNP